MTFEVSKGNVFLFLLTSDPWICPRVLSSRERTLFKRITTYTENGKQNSRPELLEKYNGRAGVWLSVPSLSKTLGSTPSTKQSKTKEQQKRGVKCITRLSLENRQFFFSTKNIKIYFFSTAPDCLLIVCMIKLSSEIRRWWLPKCSG